MKKIAKSSPINNVHDCPPNTTSCLRSIDNVNVCCPYSQGTCCGSHGYCCPHVSLSFIILKVNFKI